MYSYKTEQPDGKVKNNKTAKGVKKNITKRDLDHSDYLACTQNNAIMQHRWKAFYQNITKYLVMKLIKPAYHVMMIKGIY